MLILAVVFLSVVLLIFLLIVIKSTDSSGVALTGLLLVIIGSLSLYSSSIGHPSSAVWALQEGMTYTVMASGNGVAIVRNPNNNWILLQWKGEELQTGKGYSYVGGKFVLFESK